MILDSPLFCPRRHAQSAGARPGNAEWDRLPGGARWGRAGRHASAANAVGALPAPDWRADAGQRAHRRRCARHQHPRSLGARRHRGRFDDATHTGRDGTADPDWWIGQPRSPVGGAHRSTGRLLDVRAAPGAVATRRRPAGGFDPLLAATPFAFKVECPSDFDCETVEAGPPPGDLEPAIDYLAKDFGSFRQLMLDRLAVVMPDWQERNVADLGIALVEVLAYAADHLSYFQDAVATEAYLDTARRRISVRRHARLVDYFIHDGSNARAWVCLTVASLSNADGATLPTGHAPPEPRVARRSNRLRDAARRALARGRQQHPDLYLGRSELHAAQRRHARDPARRRGARAEQRRRARLRGGPRAGHRTGRRRRSGAPPRRALERAPSGASSIR